MKICRLLLLLLALYYTSPSWCHSPAYKQSSLLDSVYSYHKEIWANANPETYDNFITGLTNSIRKIKRDKPYEAYLLIALLANEIDSSLNSTEKIIQAKFLGQCALISSSMPSISTYYYRRAYSIVEKEEIADDFRGYEVLLKNYGEDLARLGDYFTAIDILKLSLKHAKTKK